jgi:hypothetical protein
MCPWVGWLQLFPLLRPHQPVWLLFSAFFLVLLSPGFCSVSLARSSLWPETCRPYLPPNFSCCCLGAECAAMPLTDWRASSTGRFEGKGPFYSLSFPLSTLDWVSKAQLVCTQLSSLQVDCAQPVPGSLWLLSPSPHPMFFLLGGTCPADTPPWLPFLWSSLPLPCKFLRNVRWSLHPYFSHTWRVWPLNSELIFNSSHLSFSSHNIYMQFPH